MNQFYIVYLPAIVILFLALLLYIIFMRLKTIRNVLAISLILTIPVALFFGNILYMGYVTTVRDYHLIKVKFPLMEHVKIKSVIENDLNDYRVIGKNGVVYVVSIYGRKLQVNSQLRA